MNEEFRESKSTRDNYACKAENEYSYHNNKNESGKVARKVADVGTGGKIERRHIKKDRGEITGRESGVKRKYFSKDIDSKIITVFDTEIISAFREMPQLRNYIRSIGSRLEMGRRMRAEAYNWLIRYHIRAGVNYEDAKKSADKHIAEFSKINMSENAIAMYTTFKSKFEDANRKIFYKYNGIYLNDKWKSIKELNDTVRLLCNRGVFSRGSGDIRQIIAHEIGHAICEMLKLEKHAYIRKLYFKNGNKISEYAAMNVAEFIAEVWAEYKTGSRPRNVCCKMGKLIQSEYKKYIRNQRYI